EESKALVMPTSDMILLSSDTKVPGTKPFKMSMKSMSCVFGV
ncbi:11448_t:CDS:1, partial [Funneliformis geosporum]